MEQSMTAPPATNLGTPLQAADADADGEAINRKRARFEAHNKFRVVGSVVLAYARMSRLIRYDIEVNDDVSREQAQALAAQLSSARLDEQPWSEEQLVVAYGQEVLCTTHPEAEGQMSNGFFSNLNQGYDATAHYTTQHESSEPLQQNSDNGFLSVPYQAYTNPDPQRSGPYGQVVGEMFTQPDAVIGFLHAPDQEQHTIEGDESGPYEQGLQQVQQHLDEPDNPGEGLRVEVSPRAAPRRSDWRSLGDLLKKNKEDATFLKVLSDLNDNVTKQIEDLASGSGREKVHKLVEDAEEIIRKFDNLGLISKGKKSQKLREDTEGTTSTLPLRQLEGTEGTTSTVPTIRQLERYLGDVLEKLQGHVNEHTNGLLGRQGQLTNLDAMSRLIENGRKVVRNLGSGTSSIAEKLNTLKKDLEFRELTVEKHFQKCAASIPTVIQSFLEQQKANFVSVNSLIDWYFEEQSS